MFEKILVGTDFSNHSRAAFWAALAMARTFQSQLCLLHVATQWNPVRAESDPDGPLQIELESWLPKAVYESSCTQLVQGQTAAEEIVRIAKDQRYELIAIGAHGRNTMTDLLFGSEALKVVQKALCPVMIVRDFSAAHADRFRARKILVPTDFSDVAFNALQLAGRISTRLNSQLHFIHVLDLPALEEVHAKFWKDKLNLKEVKDLNVNSVLKALAERAGIKGNVEYSTLAGDPSEEIRRYAMENEVELLVMGTHGRKRLERLIVGSVAANLIASSSCPVVALSEYVQPRIQEHVPGQTFVESLKDVSDSTQRSNLCS